MVECMISGLSAYKMLWPYAALVATARTRVDRHPCPLVRIDSDIRLLKISCNYNAQ
jgi:hypothetical protein